VLQAQPNDAKEARPMQVAGGLADRQCTKSSGGLPCLPVWTDSLSHTVQLVYTSSGPYDTQPYLRIFVDNHPQPVLTTFINIDECAVSSADHLLYALSQRTCAFSHPNHLQLRWLHCWQRPTCWPDNSRERVICTQWQRHDPDDTCHFLHIFCFDIVPSR
jgi:hypothetical protein